MGAQEGSESLNGRLLIIYMIYHFKRRTPILIHENVPGFEASKMADVAAGYGYGCITISCRPMDVGFHVGRPRRQPTCTKQIVTSAYSPWGYQLINPFSTFGISFFVIGSFI